MHTKWMRLWGLGALILVLTPLLAVGQTRTHEALPAKSSDRSRGEVQVTNDWVAYLSPADNTSGSLPSRLRGGNQPVIRSRNPFSRPHPVWLPCV